MNDNFDLYNARQQATNSPVTVDFSGILLYNFLLHWRLLLYLCNVLEIMNLPVGSHTAVDT